MVKLKRTLPFMLMKLLMKYAELLKDVCNHLIEHRMELSDSQVDTLLKAIELRRIELLAGVVRKGGKNE